MALKNQLQSVDRAIHDWYRFVLAFPPHLVRHYLEHFGADPAKHVIFDPFSGTATTPLEARLNGFVTVACDVNPVAALANRTKLNWSLDPEQLLDHLALIQQLASHLIVQEGLSDSFGVQQLGLWDTQLPDVAIDHLNMDPVALSADANAIIPQGFISHAPLKRVLAIRTSIEQAIPVQTHQDFFRLALASTIVSKAGNIAFGPEVYRTRAKDDVDVLTEFITISQRMIVDLIDVQSSIALPYPAVYFASDDARTMDFLDNTPPIDMVITSPPYPNEKDYTRATRLESVLLGFLSSKHDLRALKQQFLRSNSRTVYKGDTDDAAISDIQPIMDLAAHIEAERIRLGKTSGFEKLYHRVVTLYFGGMYHHLVALHERMRSGGFAAYVVGDQQSFFQVHIATAELLGLVAEKAGFGVEGIEKWRDRFSTATKTTISENVLILRKP